MWATVYGTAVQEQSLIAACLLETQLPSDTFPLMPLRPEMFSTAFYGFLLPEGDSPRSAPPRWRPPDRGSGPRPESRCWLQGAEAFVHTGRHKKSPKRVLLTIAAEDGMDGSLAHGLAQCTGSGVSLKKQDVWTPFSRNPPSPGGRGASQAERA